MFHSYVNSIGFKNDEILEELLKEVIENPDGNYEICIDGKKYVEFYKDIVLGAGIAIFGYYNSIEDESVENFVIEYYFPYAPFNEESILECKNVSLERFCDKYAYLGMFDSYIMSMILIFYLKDSEFISKIKYAKNMELEKCKIGISALSSSGTILLPMARDDDEDENQKNYKKMKVNLMERAKNGDEEAIEKLTIDDFETQQMLFVRTQNEDVLSIVETYFMPDGLENDKYAIMGDILSVESAKNLITKKTIYKMMILSNDMKINLIINKENLIGEPLIGRRFRGKIWLQGKIIL